MTDLLYGTIFRPRETFHAIAKEPPVFKSFIIFTIVTIVSLITSVVLLPHTLAKEAMPGFIAESIVDIYPLLGIIGAVLAYVNWFVVAAVFNLFAEFFDGEGSALGTLCVLGLAQLVSIVVLPLQVIGAVMGPGLISSFFIILSSLISVIWWLILIVIGISEVHNLSSGKAIASITGPIFFFLLAGGIIFIAGMGLVIPFLNMVGI